MTDTITLIRDPAHILGKRFRIDKHGNLSKEAAVTVATGVAKQQPIRSVTELQQLLGTVATDPHAAIIPSAFPLANGQEFLVRSTRSLENLGFKRYDDNLTWPVKTEFNGMIYDTLGRFKEHTTESSWLLFDRDMDKYTPQWAQDMSYDDWLSAVDLLMPGFLLCARLRAYSSSARVLRDGKPVGGGNGHTWLQIIDPEDIPRFKSAVLSNAIALGMAWKKPRICKKTGEATGWANATILDLSVFTKGRLVFVGKPVVSNDLQVIDQKFEVVEGGRLDTRRTLPAAPEVVKQKLKEDMQIDADVTMDRDGKINIAYRDLRFDTNIETERHGTLPLEKVLDLPRNERGELHMRCQTPFRDSTSWAAFVSVGSDGKPFVFDNGSGTHWLSDEDWERICFKVELSLDILGSTKHSSNNPHDQEDTEVLAAFPTPFRGVMEESVTALLTAAHKQQPELTTLAALIGMSSACSGFYALPDGARLNLYGCGVLETGGGKELPRVLTETICMAAGGKLIGAPASGSGLEDALDSGKGMLVAIDEVAHYFAAMEGSKAPAYLVDLARKILQLFSASRGFYVTRVLAQTSGGQPSRTLNNPTISMIGFSTEEKLGSALTVADIESGLLGRQLFVRGRKDVKPRRTRINFELPPGVVSAAVDVQNGPKNAQQGKGNLVGHIQGDVHVELSDEADARLDILLQQFDTVRSSATWGCQNFCV
jgi:hypothetical protein